MSKAVPFTPFRQLTGQAPSHAHNSRDLMMQCDAQIPSIIDAADFDSRNPEHMQAFEEEMSQMMSVAMARQASIQRAQYAANSGQRKLSLREIELAAKGLSIPQVRQAMSSAAHDRSEINAGRALPAQSVQSPTKKATPKRVLNKAAAHAKAFASRAEEGEFLGRLAYQDRMKSVKAKFNDVGEAYAQSTMRMPNTYTAQHVTKELKFHPNKCDSTAARTRMIRHESQKLKAAAGARQQFFKEQELARIRAEGSG